MKFHIVTDTDGRVAPALHDLDMPDEDYARLRSKDFPRGPVYLDVSRAAEALKHRS